MRNLSEAEPTPDLARRRVRLEHVERDPLRSPLLHLADTRKHERLRHPGTASTWTHVHDAEMGAPAVGRRRIGDAGGALVVLGQVDGAAGEAAGDLLPLVLPALRADVVRLRDLGVELRDQLAQHALVRGRGTTDVHATRMPVSK